MTRAATLISALLVPLALACGANEAPAPTKVAGPPEAAPPEPAAEASAPGPVAADGVPKITSDAPVHEFGGIKPTDSVDHVFKIRNAGTADLKIERVQRT
ncbi:MAG: DUF1573 domain-containing protein [Myxococcales bacterium]|nr:DUF1573 domain-containing protein [Myxococcales bacterium]MCB9718900.1 DUF1573 domain-containing protein [Myxococcales bacterium]